ncbi:MAG: site-2 protease family protein [Acidimicrobiia bacterium]
MIKFSLGGIPVSVRPTFWLVAGLLGFGLEGPELVAIWVAIVFVSVLAHELGHAVTARGFGAEVAITLTTLGGLTSWRAPEGHLSPGRRAAVAAAGSAVGIVLGLVVLGVYLAVAPISPTVRLVVRMIVWVNVGWGVLNWLPIRPLDGGHLLTSLLELVLPRKADRVGDVIFLVTSLLALGAALYFRFIFVAILAGFMAWSEVNRHIAPSTPAPPAVFSYDDEPDPPDGKPAEEAS